MNTKQLIEFSENYFAECMQYLFVEFKDYDLGFTVSENLNDIECSLIDLSTGDCEIEDCVNISSLCFVISQQIKAEKEKRGTVLKKADAKLFFEKGIETMKAKNADYAGDDNNVFANFEKAEKFGFEVKGVCKTSAGFIYRMSDKISRVESFLKTGVLKVQDEKIADTLEDLAVYACLFAANQNLKK